jgi:hypothetical protein
VPADPATLEWFARALRGQAGERGVLSDAERRALLQRLAADAEAGATAAAVVDTLRAAVRAEALDLTGSRRSRLHSLLAALDDRGLLPHELPRPGDDDDWVDALRADVTPPVPPPAPPPAPPPLDGGPRWEGQPVTTVRADADRRVSLLRAALLPGGPPLGDFAADALLADAPATGPGRLAGAAAALLAAVHLSRHPIPGRAADLALARDTEHRPLIAAFLGGDLGDEAARGRAAVDALLAPRPVAWGVAISEPALLGLLGGAALAGGPAAVEAMLAELPRLAALSAQPGRLDDVATDALLGALRGYIEDSEAVTFSFGRWPDAVTRAVGEVTAARATSRWVGPAGSLAGPAPHLDGVGVPTSAVPWLTHALTIVRDATAAKRLVDALRRARDVVPGAEGRPASGTAIALLRRCLVQEEHRAEASPDGRSDLAALPEAVASQAAALLGGLRAWMAGLAATPPVVRVDGAPPITVPASLANELRDLAANRVASERSLPNLAAAVRVYAVDAAVDDAAAAALTAFLQGYLAAWPHLDTFDFNKLERMARAARDGDSTPLCRINGEACDPGRFHAEVGRYVAEALAHIPFALTWIPHRFGYRARQAIELVDLLAERTAQSRGPLAALSLLHPGATVRVVATTSDLEYNCLVYAVDSADGRAVYYMDSAGQVHAHARLPEPKHVLFEADVDPKGRMNVSIPQRLSLSPRAYPLMNTYGLGDRIDVEVFDVAASDVLVEAERFQTRYKVYRGTITGFDNLGNHRVIVDEPTGPVERTVGYEQLRTWNNPHLVPEEGGVACGAALNRSTDSRFADDLEAMTEIARAHGLPLFDLSLSEVALSQRQKAFLKALNAFTSRTLRYPRHPAIDDADRAYEARLSTGTHPMGAYLEIARGVCRHQFIREHMGKQRAGIDERFASGAANTYTGAFRGLHIWGEVSLADRSRLVMDTPETADARYLSDATWGDAWVPLWEGAYGNDLRRVEMYDRTRSYASLLVRSTL